MEERTRKVQISYENLKKEIMERKPAQKGPQQIKINLQAVFNAISDPLVLMEKDMTVKMINSSAARYYGLSGHRDIIGAKCHELLMKSTAPCSGCIVPNGLAHGKGIMFEREGFMEQDRLEQVFLYPVLHRDSGDLDILMRISDITEQRMMERQMIHSEKMAAIGTLISTIVHEINNPNSLIRFNIPILRDYVNEMMPIVDAYAETHPNLEMGSMTYADFRRDISTLLDNIEHGSLRISGFVSNLKDFSRFNADVKGDWIEMRQVIEKVVAICNARLKKDVEFFTIDMPEDLPRIWSDAAALEQIVLNLLINAVQAVEGKKGSRVRLAVEIRDRWIDHAVLEVTDNGSGMDEETRNKIFDPFFTTKSRQEGVGLGLYVCQNLVERLRGRIEIESRPGKGSTFRVILPDKERRSQQRL